MTDFAGPFIPGHVVTAAEWNQSKTAHDEVVSANDVQNGLISALQAADTDLDARMDVVETYAQSIAALTTAQQKAEFLSAVQNPSWFRTMYYLNHEAGPTIAFAPVSRSNKLAAKPQHILFDSNLAATHVMARVGGSGKNAYTACNTYINVAEFAAVAPVAPAAYTTGFMWYTAGVSYGMASDSTVAAEFGDTATYKLIGIITATNYSGVSYSLSSNGTYVRIHDPHVSASAISQYTLAGAKPLTEGVKRCVSNKHSYGTATTQGTYDYIWGRATASTNRLVSYRTTNASPPAIVATTSADAGITISYADVFSVDGSYQFAVVGDGTTVKVSYDPRGSMSWALSYTPVEAYDDIINLVVKGRYLVGTRGTTSLMWTWYDVTGGTATLFATNVPMGGIVNKHLPKFGSTNTTLSYHRYVPTAEDCGIGVACDSRLDWNP